MKKLERPKTLEINMEPTHLLEKKENRLPLEMVAKATDLMSHLYPDANPERPFIGSAYYYYLFMNCLTVKYHMSAFGIPFDIFLDFPEWPDKYDGQQLLQLRVVLDGSGVPVLSLEAFPIERKEIVTLDGSHPKWYFTTILTEMFLRTSYTCKKLMEGSIMINPDFCPYL